MDDAALKVLKAAEETKQVLAEKEEILAGIREEFERKSKEASVCADYILRCALHGHIIHYLCVEMLVIMQLSRQYLLA